MSLLVSLVLPICLSTSSFLRVSFAAEGGDYVLLGGGVFLLKIITQHHTFSTIVRTCTVLSHYHCKAGNVREREPVLASSRGVNGTKACMRIRGRNGEHKLSNFDGETSVTVHQLDIFTAFATIIID